MIPKNALRYALLEYRTNPGRPEQGSFPIGIALEFTTAEYWVVALVLRANLDPVDLSSTDALTRELLENRAEILKAEVTQVIERAQSPGDVLRILADENPWSIHVSSPMETRLPSKDRQADLSVEKLLDHFIAMAWKRALAGAVNAPVRTQMSTALDHGADVGGGIAVEMPIQIPSLWMLPPASWRTPIV